MPDLGFVVFSPVGLRTSTKIYEIYLEKKKKRVCLDVTNTLCSSCILRGADSERHFHINRLMTKLEINKLNSSCCPIGGNALGLR